MTVCIGFMLSYKATRLMLGTNMGQIRNTYITIAKKGRGYNFSLAVQSDTIRQLIQLRLLPNASLDCHTGTRVCPDVDRALPCHVREGCGAVNSKEKYVSIYKKYGNPLVL